MHLDFFFKGVLKYWKDYRGILINPESMEMGGETLWTTCKNRM